MATATDLLRHRASTIRELIDELLDRSSITHFARDRGGMLWLGPTGEWGDLDVEAQRLQSRALEDYRGFFEALSVLLSGQPPNVLRALESTDKSLRGILEQSGLTAIKSVEEAREKAHNALGKQVGLLERLHDSDDGGEVYVVDTNALLYNPDLDRWEFEGAAKFELVLAPAALVELDELKINHRNPNLREKAEGVISRIKGYRARGKLTEGVPLRKDISAIRALATEPKMDESLSWLDPTNRDDRLIATTIEVIRQRPRSAVRLVTRDINLQSKAELASLPFVEPPEPTKP